MNDKPTYPEDENLPEKIRRDLERIRRQKEKAQETGSRVEAVRAFCLDCHGGHWSEVRQCGSRNCSLWPFRMGSPQRDGERT